MSRNYRKNIAVNIRPEGTDYDDTTVLTVKMAHEQQELVRAALSSVSPDTKSPLYKIASALTDGVDWRFSGNVKVTGSATVEPVAKAKPLPTTPGTVFKGEVSDGWYGKYTGDIFVAKTDLGSLRYITKTPVNGAISHPAAKVKAL